MRAASPPITPPAMIPASEVSVTMEMRDMLFNNNTNQHQWLDIVQRKKQFIVMSSLQEGFEIQNTLPIIFTWQQFPYYLPSPVRGLVIPVPSVEGKSKGEIYITYKNQSH